MKILERGFHPSETVYRARCQQCRTLYEFRESEGKLVDDQRDGPAVVSDCPVCLNKVWTAQLTAEQRAMQVAAADVKPA